MNPDDTSVTRIRRLLQGETEGEEEEEEEE